MTSIVSLQFAKCNKSLNNGDVGSAYAHLDEALSHLLKIHPQNSIQWAIYYLNLSSVHNNSGRFQESIDSCEKAGKVLKKSRDRRLMAKLACNLASAYLNLSDYTAAQKSIQTAIRFYQKERQKAGLAEALLTLGQILLRKGEWIGAIERCSKALLLARQGGDNRMAGKALIRLGYIFRADPEIFQEGGYPYLAIDHFRQAEKCFRDAAYRPGMIEALYERANTCICLDMVEKTRELIKRIENSTPPESPMRSFLLNLTYCLHNREGQFENAIADSRELHGFYERAGDKKGVADSLEKLGSAYYNLRDIGQARKYGRQALSLAAKIGDELIQMKSRQLLIDIDKISNVHCGEQA